MFPNEWAMILNCWIGLFTFTRCQALTSVGSLWDPKLILNDIWDDCIKKVRWKRTAEQKTTARQSNHRSSDFFFLLGLCFSVLVRALMSLHLILSFLFNISHVVFSLKIEIKLLISRMFFCSLALSIIIQFITWTLDLDFCPSLSLEYCCKWRMKGIIMHIYLSAATVTGLTGEVNNSDHLMTTVFCWPCLGLGSEPPWSGNWVEPPWIGPGSCPSHGCGSDWHLWNWSWVLVTHTQFLWCVRTHCHQEALLPLSGVPGLLHCLVGGVCLDPMFPSRTLHFNKIINVIYSTCPSFQCCRWWMCKQDVTISLEPLLFQWSTNSPLYFQF